MKHLTLNTITIYTYSLRRLGPTTSGLDGDSISPKPNVGFAANLPRRTHGDGIKDFRFHDLRHTFASRYMMNDGDLYELAKILGHSNIKMTERYAKLARQPHCNNKQHIAGNES